MLRGHLDAITSSGFVEGWAYNQAAPLDPVAVSVIHDGTEIARATARQYREDLAESGCGTGWCAFRARVSAPAEQARRMALALTDAASGAVIQNPRILHYYKESEPEITSIEDVIRHDPTLLGPIDRLKACGEIFQAYINLHGVPAFVRTAYIFVLSRPADSDGLNVYTGLMRQGLLHPFNLLRELADSQEFRSKPRMLSAPGSPSFPFQSA